MMMATLSINCWNCQGLGALGPNTQMKMDFLETHFSSRPFDILGLVETRHSADDDLPNLIHEYSLTHHIVHTHMHASDTCGGILVVMSKLFKNLCSLAWPYYHSYSSTLYYPNRVSFYFLLWPTSSAPHTR